MAALSKGDRKKYNKANDAYRKAMKAKNNPQGQGKGNKNSKAKDKELNYDKCDFPIAYSDKSLVQNWFDFNDAGVEPLMPGALQKQFGGTSGNAYMLVYRQRNLNKQDTLDIPEYWKEPINTQNEVEEQQRIVYEALRNQLDIVI